MLSFINSIIHNLKLILQKRGILSKLPWIPGLIGAGILLRLSGINMVSLWYDEAFSMIMTRQSLLEMVKSLKADVNPPGWEIILWIVTHIFGANELSIRLLSVFSGIVLIFVTYSLCKELNFSTGRQILAIGMLALSPYQFWMAQDGRTYAFLSLLYLLGILWVIKGRWVGVCGVVGLMLWLHNTAIVYIPALLIIALITRPNEFKSISLTFLIGSSTWLIWAPITLSHSQSNLPFTVPLNFQTSMEAFMPAIFAWTLPTFWNVVGIILIILCVFWGVVQLIIRWIVDNSNRSTVTKSQLIHIYWKSFSQSLINNHQSIIPNIALLIPLILFILIAIFIQNTLIYRTLSPLLPVFFVWLSLILISKKLKTIGLIISFFWVLLYLIALSNWSPEIRSGGLQQAIDNIKSEWQQGDIIYHNKVYSALLFKYYLPDAPAYIAQDRDADPNNELQITRIDLPQVPLDAVPHQRSWVMISQETMPGKNENNQVDKLVKNCPLTDQVRYWQIMDIFIYLCGSQ